MRATQGPVRRSAILTFVRQYAQKHGYGPSIQEVSERVGIGKTAVRHHLTVLQREGKVDWTPGHYRSLRAK